MLTIVETDFHKIEAFHNGCIRRICLIFWPRTISNLATHAKTYYELLRKQLKIVENIFRVSQNRIKKDEPENRKEGRLKPGEKLKIKGKN